MSLEILDKKSTHQESSKLSTIRFLKNAFKNALGTAQDQNGIIPINKVFAEYSISNKKVSVKEKAMSIAGKMLQDKMELTVYNKGKIVDTFQSQKGQITIQTLEDILQNPQYHLSLKPLAKRESETKLNQPHDSKNAVFEKIEFSGENIPKRENFIDGKMQNYFLYQDSKIKSELSPSETLKLDQSIKEANSKLETFCRTYGLHYAKFEVYLQNQIGGNTQAIGGFSTSILNRSSYVLLRADIVKTISYSNLVQVIIHENIHAQLSRNIEKMSWSFNKSTNNSGLRFDKATGQQLETFGLNLDEGLTEIITMAIDLESKKEILENSGYGTKKYNFVVQKLYRLSNHFGNFEEFIKVSIDAKKSGQPKILLDYLNEKAGLEGKGKLTFRELFALDFAKIYDKQINKPK